MRANAGPEDVQARTFNINAAIHAPFNGLDEKELEDKVAGFVEDAGLTDYSSYFLKAGFVAQSDDAFNCPTDGTPLGLSLSTDEMTCLEEEKTRRWKHPGALWRLVALCALGAAVQGWDEAAVDGGMLFQACGRLAGISWQCKVVVLILSMNSPDILYLGLWHWRVSSGPKQKIRNYHRVCQ